jgi:Flp pilus assembly protein TadB
LEILALLLLGLIAMLAIVPPIIRGKLEESPLASTQSFQRSMQEMANSIESGNGRGAAQYRDRGPSDYGVAARAGREGRLRPAPARTPRRNSAAVRRSRIMVSLTVFAALWGVATLVSGKAWCMVIFAIVCGLLVIFWALALIIPNMAARPRVERHLEEPSRSPRSQAL